MAERQGCAIVFYFTSPKRRRSESMADSHSQSLIAKHAMLDARITSETRRPMPDEIVLHALKKQKLRIKEAIARLT
jgi:hypothetical protein